MAAGGKLFGTPNMTTLLLQNERLPPSSDVLDSIWAHTSNPAFPGSKSMVNFERLGGCRVTDRQFLHGVEKEDTGEEDFEMCFHQAGKKRRLTSEQVQFLEKNFEVENKLEPERKVQLAKELGLQPRQVAIWFQNRRARFKTKRLEQDYGKLKASYDKLKSDHDNLVKENDKLKEEVKSLKNRLNVREKEKEDSHKSEANADPGDSEAVNSAEGEPQEEDRTKDGGGGGGAAEKGIITVWSNKQQEDANSSAKSDVLDSDDTEANHHSWMQQDPADSSPAAEAEAAEHSDFSQEEEDDNLMRNNLLNLACFPKVEEDGCYDDPPEGCCNNFGFPEDQTFCFWPY